ncbi:transcriptional regulatory protein [Phlyctema vagabunda]|uniref:Transcriptional regulatory protein n=1 Tax=Phlyctema vagabunda TaxID=108571 RepID=A0ABR4PNU5_9HELO
MSSAGPRQKDPGADDPQASDSDHRSISPEQQHGSPTATSDKPINSAEKTISCVSCRRRKLKCDRTKPKCSTCSRLRHDCEYPERRRNLGSKRRNMKELEARLAQVETRLVSEANASGVPTVHECDSKRIEQDCSGSCFPPVSMDLDLDDGNGILYPDVPRSYNDSAFTSQSASQDLVSLGVQESLPLEENQRELFHIYFDKIHPSLPMIHKYRFQAALKLGQNLKPPVCLQYAMWSVAASVSSKYLNFEEVFYERARRYAEAAEMEGRGESFITYHAQCWALIATIEATKTYFTRAWMSTGKCIRLVQMTGLHRLDEDEVEVRQMLGPPKDAIDLEERRRTFWAAFYGDRWASAGTGWPMTINEADIFTNLPSSEEAFDEGKPEISMSLSIALAGDGASRIRSPFAGVIIAAALFGHNFAHIHLRSPNERPYDVSNGAFWQRHREMDNAISNIFMHLPERFRLPQGLHNFDIVFLNMNIHTSTICLHQAAILATAKHGLDPKLKWLSVSRCLMAADEITTIMRLVSHIDPATINPWTGFCVYVAAGVYVHNLRLGRPPKPHSASNLDFLLVALKAIGKRHPITQHFSIQLGFDIESAGLDATCPSLHRETGVVSAMSSNTSSSGSRTSDASLANFNEHDAARIPQSAKFNGDESSHENFGKTTPLTLSGIISYDEKCLLQNTSGSSNYYEPVQNNASQYLNPAQNTSPNYRERAPSSSHSPSNMAIELSRRLVTYLPKGSPDVLERLGHPEQALPNDSHSWVDTNSLQFGPYDARSQSPPQLQPLGLINKSLMTLQAQLDLNNPDQIHPKHNVSGVDFSNIAQYPIRQNRPHSPDYDIWNPQHMEVYSMDIDWNIDVADGNVHENFNAEADGIQDFLTHTGLAQWNRG